jgi:hypothetical protein
VISKKDKNIFHKTKALEKVCQRRNFGGFNFGKKQKHLTKVPPL